MVRKDAASRLAEVQLSLALKRYEPRVAAAFRAAVRLVQSEMSITQIADALRRGAVDEALRLAEAATLGSVMRGIGLAPGVRSVMDELTDALRAGAVTGQMQMPSRAGLQASLDLTNPESVRYLRDTVPVMIREIDDAQRMAVRAAALQGMTDGRPVINIARDIRRSVGLTEAMGRAVTNFRHQLETGEMGAGKAPWDRRLSAVERQQARSIFAAGGRRGAQVDALVGRYNDSLVNRRAQNIARTEVHRAYVEGQEELWRQATDRGLLDVTLTRRMWIVTPDDRLRPDHRAIPGMNPDGSPIGGQFQTPFGPVSSPSDGVPELINCFLPSTVVRGSFVGGLKSWYSGEVVEIQTARGHTLTVTPNHPVMTTRGLVAAGGFGEGHDLIAYEGEIRGRLPGGVTAEEYIDHGPSLIKDVFEAMASATGRRAVDVTRLDLHGDEVFLQGNIHKVGADGQLQDGTFFMDDSGNLPLVFTDVTQSGLIGSGGEHAGLHGGSPTPRSRVGGSNLSSSCGFIHRRPFNPFRIGATPDLDAMVTQCAADGAARHADLGAELLKRGAGLIAVDQVRQVRRYPFSGHVYDLQSVTGYMVAQGIVTSNCRCAVALRINE